MSKPNTTRTRRHLQQAAKHSELTPNELKIVAQEIAERLNLDGDVIGLLLMLFDHIEEQGSDFQLLVGSISIIKDFLFVRTTKAGDAQKQLQDEVRTKVLPFTGRRSA